MYIKVKNIFDYLTK